MKILVVDREEDLGAALDILAKTPGNEVQSARTGDEALAITEGQEVDLLITEVFLEPMNGFTLRNKMENRHAGVRTIFLSGYDLSPYAEHTEGYEIIAKPATPQKLFPAIARAMAGNGGVEAPAPDFTSRPPVTAPKAPPSARGPALKPLSTAPPVPPPALAPHPVPMATPAGMPKAVPAAKPAAQAPAAAADPLIGKQLGNYRIERRLGKGKWGPVYLANQTSMNRPVAMELLAAEMMGDEVARQNFVATARAKAAVQHPHILSVYEADQAEGYYFYTHEYVDGLTLAQMAARGEGLSEQTALQTVKCVAQGLAHLQHNQIAHAIPDATDIFVGSDGLPYLSNVAQPGKEMPSVQEEICALGEVIRTVLPGGQAREPGLRAMLTRMGITNQMGFQSWPPLFQAIQAIEPKVVPVDAFKLSAQDEAAIRAVEEARKRQRRVVAGSVAGLVVFLCILGAAIWWEFLRPTSHDFSDEMVKVEAGDFIYQDGQKLSLPTFYIDKYEVTIAEYAKFLQYVSDHDNSTDFDSPLQPRGRTHVPENWDIYYSRASYPLSEGRTFKGVPITLDCPVFNVDYFDAYAYAKWKGRRLPTQQEWEKAARGPTGLIYPWGNTWDPGKLNSGADYQAHPASDYKPAVDGFTWWAPVNAILTDRSPYGAIGMAGNVSEWTDSWDPSRTYVYIRGGNFKSDAAGAMNTAQIKTYPQEYMESLGFRTASDHPPARQ